VRKLQEDLKKFNLFGIEPTGYYGTLTEHAVYKFQQKKGIVASKTDSGAGTFGPQTRKAFNDILGYRANTKALIASKTENYIEETIKVESNPSFTQELMIGSVGEQVTLLQEKLKTLGFYEGNVTTDYFGKTTKNAVIAFQQNKGIISSINDPGAGLVGPQTRAVLNSLSN
jgi:peptidoglycan hydrolase-like protein with peptidoglycan-binding domain